MATDSKFPQFGKHIPGVTYVQRPGAYAIIFNSEGELAVVKTPHGWFLPGGGQEEGESPAEAAVREAREECGLQIRILRPLGRADQIVFSAEEATGWHKCCVFLLAEADAARRSDGEADHVLCWVKPEEAASLMAHESQRWGVLEAMRFTHA